MNLKLRLSKFLSVIIVLGFLIGSVAPVMADAAWSRSGWFSIVWGDSVKGATGERYTLTDDSGATIELQLDDALIRSLGGVLSFDRKYVTVQGVPSEARFGQAVKVTAIQSTREADVRPAAVTGSKPWVSIMCKFTDVADEPKNLAYFQNMYASTYPGLDHYWREVSFDIANVAGSGAFGWYTLPHPASYYNPSATQGGADLDLLANDCTAAANADVNFSQYQNGGINMMFNFNFDYGYAWGGGKYMTLDGVSQVWSVTWEPPWGYESITVMSHEMGHGFGLPHSSGTYGQTYDNRWDVMSDTWTDCGNSSHATYGCLGQHTISYHKDILGWIAANQKYTYTGGTATITLEQLAEPQTGNYLMAKLPIGGSSSHFYTVEVRRNAGYDVKLPGEAVIIHEVDTTRSRPAYVMDSDGNGNTGDAGAMWTVGETFTDAANGISVSVLSATSTGFQISIDSKLKSISQSIGAYDGYVWESIETSGIGLNRNVADPTFQIGDDNRDRQYRGFLSFNTASLPDNAVITKVTLKIRQSGLPVGTNPFTTHGGLRVDIRKPYFGTTIGLIASDFEAIASRAAVGTFGATPVNSWYSAVLGGTAYPFINLTGSTQFRLRFVKDDNDDLSADYMSFISGNHATVNARPTLIIEYYVP